MCDCKLVFRIYTGIHAKPKPKFKSGAISESTTALNVDQSNTSVLNNGDQKNAAVSAAVPLQSLLAPCTMASKGGNSQDQLAAVGPMHETEVSGSAAAPTTSTLKKDVGLSKVQAVKKKMDARKKSLKRLWFDVKVTHVLNCHDGYVASLCCLSMNGPM